MRSLGLGRYSLEWLGLLVSLGAIGVLVTRSVAPEAGPGLVVAALMVVAGLDLTVYAIVARGLLGDPDQFMSWWGLSMALKIFVLGMAVVAVLLLRVEGRDVFLLTLGAALPLFTIHQLVRLVIASDRLRLTLRTRSGGEGLVTPPGLGGGR